MATVLGDRSGEPAPDDLSLILEWRPRAVSDLAALRATIAHEQPAAAKRTAERIIAAAELLRAYPGLGRYGRSPGTRELAVARTPYLVIYEQAEDAVTVLRVLHGAQDWP
jgi:toxin ParE1/3/4